jgi:hypothetical protein
MMGESDRQAAEQRATQRVPQSGAPAIALTAVDPDQHLTPWFDSARHRLEGVRRIGEVVSDADRPQVIAAGGSAAAPATTIGRTPPEAAPVSGAPPPA